MAKKIFYVTRTEDEDAGRAGPATLLRADDPQLMKVYETKEAMADDDENIGEGEIVGSEETDYVDIAITDSIEENNMNPVTSNAVSTVLQAIYHVGSIYLSVLDTNPADIFGFGEWERVAQNMALWGSSADGEAGTTKAAGLPNITGSFEPRGDQVGNSAGVVKCTGAFYATIVQSCRYHGTVVSETETTAVFDASRSNPIYGNSTTVQPPALVVNIWKRVA